MGGWTARGRRGGRGGDEGKGGGQICRLSELCDEPDVRPRPPVRVSAAEFGVKSRGGDATGNEKERSRESGGENTNECKRERRDSASFTTQFGAFGYWDILYVLFNF